jgi:hypothetical protein
LPLAVYREVEAHLRQVEGIAVGLVVQRSPQFDYTLSQIDHLWIQHSDSLETANQTRVQQILAYYGDRYGAWEAVDPEPAPTEA